MGLTNEEAAKVTIAVGKRTMSVDDVARYIPLAPAERALIESTLRWASPVQLHELSPAAPPEARPRSGLSGGFLDRLGTVTLKIMPMFIGMIPALGTVMNVAIVQVQNRRAKIVAERQAHAMIAAARTQDRKMIADARDLAAQAREVKDLTAQLRAQAGLGADLTPAQSKASAAARQAAYDKALPVWKRPYVLIPATAIATFALGSLVMKKRA